MANIDFNYRLPCTSDFNSLTNIMGINGYYDVFPGDNSTITVLSGHPLLIHTVACTPVSTNVDVTFRNCVPDRFYQAQMASAAAVGETKNLVTFELATDGVKHLYFCVDLKRIPDSYYPRYSQHVYLKHVEPGTPQNVIVTTEDILTDYNFASLSGANDRYQFGFSLVKLPGRGNDPKKFALMYTYDYSYGTQTEDITLIRSGSGDIRTYTVAGAYATQALYLGCMIDLERISIVYPGLEPTIDFFSTEAGPESVQGGMNEPAFDDRSDTIGLPNNPSLDLSTMGFYNVYTSSSVDALNHLRDYLFGAPITTQSSTEDILKAIGNNLFNSKLTDYIVSCHLIPVAPVTAGTPTVTAINLGNVTCTDATMTKVTTDYVTFDCGSISLSEYYENFADFLESSKIFLPFIGFVPCRPEWFKNTTLSVQYKFNVIDGSCIAFIMSTGKYTNNGNSGTTIVGQYSGTASIRFPITGVSYASMATGVVGSIASMSVASGAGSILGVAGSAINMAQQKPEIAQSNGYNACASMLGVRRPFLYIERPVSSYARNYQHELGIPSNIFATLGTLSGYVRMDNVHLDGIPCTDEERNKIASLLKSGVVV